MLMIETLALFLINFLFQLVFLTHIVCEDFWSIFFFIYRIDLLTFTHYVHYTLLLVLIFVP